MTRSPSMHPASRESTTGPNVALEVSTHSFSGPLPPPELLAKYEEIGPGFAERIVAMAERQASHRQDLERIVVVSGSRAERFGQILAATIAVTGIVVGGFLLYHDKDIAGLTSMFGPLTGIVTVFFYGKRQQQRQLEEKRKALSKTLGRQPKAGN